MLKYPKESYPKISVIMAVFNRVKMIEKAILSLLEQDYPNLEFIVLDAGSTDGTLDIINKYMPHISYTRSHKDGGAAVAWNEGIDVSTGDVICYLNSDDYYTPGTLIKVGEAFIENPEVEMVNVLGEMVSVSNKGELTVGHRSTVEDTYLSRGHVKILHPNCRFFKRSIFEKYGKFPDRINNEPAFAGDYGFLTRISLYNPKNITLDHVGYIYLAHEGSISFNSSKYTKLKIFDQKVDLIEDLLANHSKMMDEKQLKKFHDEYWTAYERRIIRNLIDKKYNLALENLKKGTKKFGILFPLGVMRFYVSYKFRFNKLLKKL